MAIPTLVLHSEDDPIVPVDCVPLDECMHNDKIVTALTRRGSHVCYFMGTGERRWYTHACSEYLQNSLALLAMAPQNAGTVPDKTKKEEDELATIRTHSD